MPFDGEGVAGAIAKVLGDGGDPIGLVDAEAGDGEIGAVEADERDVRAVQRGDEGQMKALGGEHLTSEQCGDRVRNRVVHVQEVERVDLGDLGHARGKREVVGRVLEERIVRDRDLVIADVFFAAVEAKGLRVGDEMHLVAARRELDAELGGDNAGAAVGGVAGDADLHKGPGIAKVV